MPYMCNLYSETKGQAAIRTLFRTAHDRTGNLPAFPGIFPPIRWRRSCATARMVSAKLVIARWGMPGPQQFGSQPVTNIRNVASPLWRGWLSVRNRCLVPATSFCEYEDTKPRKTPIWFTPDQGQATVRRVATCLVGTEANAALGYVSSTPRHNRALASIVVINSNASSISGNSCVGAKPFKAGASTAWASVRRLVDR
jgi:hypothetical protein